MTPDFILVDFLEDMTIKYGIPYDIIEWHVEDRKRYNTLFYEYWMWRREWLPAAHNLRGLIGVIGKDMINKHCA